MAHYFAAICSIWQLQDRITYQGCRLPKSGKGVVIVTNQLVAPREYVWTKLPDKSSIDTDNIGYAIFAGMIVVFYFKVNDQIAGASHA